MTIFPVMLQLILRLTLSVQRRTVREQTVINEMRCSGLPLLPRDAYSGLM